MPGDRDPGLSDDPGAAAGELGQATQPPPLDSDESRSATPQRRGWLVPVCAVTAAILALGAQDFATHQPPPPEPAPATVTVPAGRAELIVRDGDLVEASGSVVGGELCAPTPVFSDPCPYGIWAPGVWPTGGATLRGRWHQGWLSNIRRMPYAPTSAGTLEESDLPDTPPCPAPAGGWRDGEDWVDDQVHEYLQAHADQFAEPFATHVGNARILVVEVVSGDVDQARAALTAIYTDNLCVVAAPGGHSIAAENRLQATTGEAVAALMDGTGRSGIYMASSKDGKIRVMMVQLTQPLYDKLAAIGLDHLILDPWIRPAGP
ncbi:hypothetical protein [Actinoplanes sp. NPDC049118]|uniref:hypothetical protein n=1 Tax=Actinoplanes sp. NPDC049118 TaxID=3155769 RepID=UPI0034084923